MAGYRRSYSTRAARGNMRAAAQQRDCADFVIKVQVPCSIAFKDSSYGTGQLCLWPTLGQASQYRQLAAIFDQVTMKGARVTLTPNTVWATTGKTAVMVFNWDRNGCLDASNAWVSPSYDQITSYSSAKMYNVGDLSVPRNYYMSIYPSNMEERIQYVSTDFIINDTQANNTYDSKVLVTQCSKLKYFPTLNIGVHIPTSGVPSGTTTYNTLDYSVQITYSLRFRGVRFQGGVNANGATATVSGSTWSPYGLMISEDGTTLHRLTI